MPYLVWESPTGRVVHALERTVTILGSDSINDIRIDHPSVERRHALIERAGEKITITDLNTEAGTRINGAQLMPDVPSTLEPGDFLKLGKVELTCLKVPPPSVDRTPPPGAFPPPASPRNPWIWVAAILAVLLVGLVGTLIAVLSSKTGESPVPTKDAPPPELAKEEGMEPVVEPPAPKVREPRPMAEPPPVKAPPEPTDAATKRPERAPKGALPPSTYATVESCPDLLELEAGRHAPVHLEDWDAIWVVALGSDGRIYSIPRSKVTKIEDRADLARRAEREKERLEPDDVKGRLALAAWCVKRQVRKQARVLAREVLAIRPDEPTASALLESLGAGE